MPLNQPYTDSIGALVDLSQASQVLVVKVASQTANAAVETPVFVAPMSSFNTAVSVNRVTLTPSAAITGAATNLQTFTLNRYDPDGSSIAANVGANYVTTVSVAKFATVVVLSTPIILDNGDILTLKDAGSGTGATTPELTVNVEYSLIPAF